MTRPKTRLISSKTTFFYKFIFPVFWVLVSCPGIWFAFGRLDAIPTEEDRDLLKIIMLLAVILGAVLMFFFYLPIKKVELCDGLLRVSNFTRTIEIPLEDVESVSGSILMNPEFVWIRFRYITDFGSRIVFAGSYRFHGGWTKHPIIKELKRLIARQRKSQDVT